MIQKEYIQFLTLINFQIMGDDDRIDPDDWYSDYNYLRGRH